MLIPIKWHLSQNFCELKKSLSEGEYLIKTLDKKIYLMRISRTFKNRIIDYDEDWYTRDDFAKPFKKKIFWARIG